MHTTRPILQTAFLSLLVIGASACSGDSVAGPGVKPTVAFALGEVFNETYTAGAFDGRGTWTVNGGSAASRWTTSPSSEDFLGTFGNDSVTLKLTGLDPAHTLVTVTVDLYIIGSWDGIEPIWGPSDRIALRVDGAEAFCTTFANDNNLTSDVGGPVPTQQFTGNLATSGCSGGSNVAAGTGTWKPSTSAQVNFTFGELGYKWEIGVDGSRPTDAVYRLTIPIAHGGSLTTFTLDAIGRNLQALSDESWGIDNIRIVIS